MAFTIQVSPGYPGYPMSHMPPPSKEWHQGLLNCCGDCGICKIIFLFLYLWDIFIHRAQFIKSSEQFSGCCGTLCFHCLVCQNANDLGKSGLLCCLLSYCFPCISVCTLRDTARRKYGIEVRYT